MHNTMNLQKAGGISAILAAISYLIPIVLFLSILAPMGDASLGFTEIMTFIKEHKTLIFLSGFITNYGLEAVITLTGSNPSGAETLKAALDAVTSGIDSSDRYLGCLWVLLICVAALRAKALPNMLCFFGFLISFPGIISSVIPTLTAMSLVFGMGVILWWLWLGVFLLSERTRNTEGLAR